MQVHWSKASPALAVPVVSCGLSVANVALWLSLPWMPYQQGVQHVRWISEARTSQTFDRHVQADKTALSRQVENSERSGDGEAPAARDIDPVAVIHEQKIRPHSDRDQNGDTLALVQA